MKINIIEGSHAQQVKRAAQKSISTHIKERINYKEVVGQ